MQSAQNDVYNLRIRELLERIESAKDRYWNIPKGVRTEHGLRPEVGDVGYSAFLILHTANEIMGKAIRGIYPITEVTPFELTITKSPPVFSSPQEVLAYLEPIIIDLENRLASCEKAYDRGGVHATDVQ